MYSKSFETIEFFHLIQKKSLVITFFLYFSFFVQMFSVVESTFRIENFNSKIQKVYTLE